MKLFPLCVSIFGMVSLVKGFMTPRPTALISTRLPNAEIRTSERFRDVDTALNVFGTKKSKSKKAADAEKAEKYWAGDWVCKDCGYIYSKSECAGLYFEEQTAGFRCPQCSGPRRRYAKKVGDRVGTTLDGGDGPILLFSFGGAFITLAFGIWATTL